MAGVAFALECCGAARVALLRLARHGTGTRVRSECLSQHYFSSVEDARTVLSEWREDYNHQRPHSALGQRTPAEVGAQARETMVRESRAIAFLDPGASSEADPERSEVEITEGPERLALRRA